ncbi:MAG: hypothetical protein KAG97_07840, partial [Victivallales bacterium]|nr:hypothetical protein [Victivallales bacterium]
MNVQNEVPIIWRSPDSEFNNDEPLSASKIYTPKVLRGIKENGFNAIWMRGRLWELGSNSEFPELNDSKASERLESLKQVIGDASEIGLKVFLYFNEPLALPEDHLFWANHPEMKGEKQFDHKTNETFPAFCTSAPRFMGLFNTAVSDMFRNLRGLGGVILITASEYHSHCWSHHPGNPVHKDERFPDMKCERCRDREPAEVVGELAEVWLKHAKLAPGTPDVWVWNWSWAMWYDQPQAEVIAALPKGVKLMCDFERGNLRKQAIGDVFIDEYSLGFVGPSERFSKSRDAAAKRGIEVAAKLQIGTTHELATVPNIPVIGNLFDKLVKIDELDLKGLMCSWNFGNTLTANTAMFGFFFKLTQEERLDRKRSLARFAES